MFLLLWFLVSSSNLAQLCLVQSTVCVCVCARVRVCAHVYVHGKMQKPSRTEAVCECLNTIMPNRGGNERDFLGGLCVCVCVCVYLKSWTMLNA